MFDAEEYLHLAIHASAKGDLHASMSYLKSALQQQPRYPMAIYLLALQHAELGLIRHAVEGLHTAISIEPRFEIARFQLGLLLFEANYADDAKAHFSKLADSENEALKLYAQGMIAWIDGDRTAAQDKLTSGLSQPSANPALSATMKRFLEHLASQDKVGSQDKAEASKTKPQSQPEPQSHPNDSPVNPIFLSSYRNTAT
jgi:tetratricopeptide (TPR) repeat protein